MGGDPVAKKKNTDKCLVSQTCWTLCFHQSVMKEGHTLATAVDCAAFCLQMQTRRILQPSLTTKLINTKNAPVKGNCIVLTKALPLAYLHIDIGILSKLQGFVKRHNPHDVPMEACVAEGLHSSGYCIYRHNTYVRGCRCKGRKESIHCQLV